MEGNTARGASSPAKPALHMPDPLSITRAAVSSSAMVAKCSSAEAELPFMCCVSCNSVFSGHGHINMPRVCYCAAVVVSLGSSHLSRPTGIKTSSKADVTLW